MGTTIDGRSSLGCSAISAEDMLQHLIKIGKITDADIAATEDMQKEQKLKEIQGLNLEKIKLHCNGKQVYLHIGEKLARRYGIKELFTAPNRALLVSRLYEAFYGKATKTLSEVFDYSYLHWRVETGTNSKTVKEDRCEYNRFFREALGDYEPRSITPLMLRDHFLLITADNAISKTRFNSAKGVLNGLFQYCCENNYMQTNPITMLNFRPFVKRFKPIDPKVDYTAEEINAICNKLEPSTNIYDIAIRFSFNLCARFGEIKAIRFSNISPDKLSIKRSVVLMREAIIDPNDNLVHLLPAEQKETVIKGATADGIRDFPLSDEAYQIALNLHNQHPDWEYLFMSNGKPLSSDTFNRHLKKVCTELGIVYRSSHVIRFTICDALYHDGDIGLRNMQVAMGHTSPTMTERYINNRGMTDEGFKKARDFLNSRRPCAK